MATTDVSFTPASGLSLEALADLFTRSFEDYFYPGITSVHTLARRVAVENINLLHSVVLRVGGEPAGVALLARRGERAWCAGFGITVPHRGQGHAHRLMGALLHEVREAGAERFSLEVLTRNTPALKVYQAAGMAIQRRLLIVSWRPDDSWADDPAAPTLEEANPTELVLRQFAALHHAPAAWQREPAALLALSELRGLALREGGEVVAYALLQGEESARLQDFAARDEPAARALLAALQRRYASILSVNEPAESPLTQAFLRSGFVVADEQHELAMAL
jgi:GNAT superfamily N-acetyltransferase